MGLQYHYQNWRRDGTRSALHGLAMRAIKPRVPYRALYGVQISVDQVKAPDHPSGELPYETRFLDQSELLGFSDREPSLSPEFAREALARGDRCYAILDGDRLAAYGWYSTQPTVVLADLYAHFDPAFSYMYKGHTEPDYRGERLHGIGMARALRALTDEGSRGIVSCVETDNVASLRSCYRMGYSRFGVVRVLGRGERARIWTSSGCAAYGFSLSPSASSRARPEQATRKAA